MVVKEKHNRNIREYLFAMMIMHPSAHVMYTIIFFILFLLWLPFLVET